MKRFRIKYNDSVKATICDSKGVLLASLYDRGFTSYKAVERRLIAKLGHISSKVLDISITNLDTCLNKGYSIKVNLC